MADHMREDSVGHISLLAAENLRLGTKLVDKEGQIVGLTEQINKLESTLNEQSLALAQMSQDLQETVQLQMQQQHDLQEL